MRLRNGPDAGYRGCGQDHGSRSNGFSHRGCTEYGDGTAFAYDQEEALPAGRRGHDKKENRLGGLCHVHKSVREVDKIVLEDSILATGGTLLSIIQALQSHGVSVQDAGVVVTRKGLGGFERVLADTGVKIKTLLYVEIVNGEVLVTEK